MFEPEELMARIVDLEAQLKVSEMAPPAAEQLIACLEGEIAKRDARIAELEQYEYAFNEWLNKTEWVQEESASFSAKYLGLHRADIMRDIIYQLLSELSAIKAQEPVMWRYKERADDQRSAWLYVKKRMHIPSGHKFEALYAAPVSEAKAQGVVMPERETELFNAAYGAAVESGWESVKCMARQIWDAARLNAAPVQQVSVPDVSVMARILADRNADACNVNREDNWAIYGQDYIDDVTAMLETALSASKDGE